MYTLVRKSRMLLPSRVYYWLRGLLRSRNLAVIFTIASAVSVVATYFAITNSGNPFGPDPKNVLGLILIDLTFLLALTAVISKRVVRLIIERRKGLAGSRLQTRIVVMFSLVAIIPSIVMAVFSLVFFHYGIQSWFDSKVSTAIEGSVEIATLYLEEHKKIIGSDILGMANDLNRAASNIRKSPRSFNSKLSILAGIRKIPGAVVFKRNHDVNTIIARTNLSFSLEDIIDELSYNLMGKATKGELVILTNDKDDRVIALIRLENYFNTYLIVSRFVDTNIINHIELTEGAANEYTKLKAGISSLQIKLFIVFVIVSVLLLLVVVWAGFIFAVSLVKPVSSLISATEKVKGGDFSTRVQEGHEDDEMAMLGRAFNRMAEQLEYQRAELISAQRRSAWSDVARRIAHEIKNPLTPIQLATDRLRRKYSDNVEDKEVFSKYVNTISRNVNSIGNMVEEFVSFARIPQPVFSDNDIRELVGDVVFSRQSNEVQINFSAPDQPIILHCDANQIARIMTNLLKNAEESIQDKKNSGNQVDSRIDVGVSLIDGRCDITIKDNGKGFDNSVFERLTEPYVTTKSKGTGLGLAIVRKIVEDHNGELKFSNIEGGACVCLSFPLGGIRV